MRGRIIGVVAIGAVTVLLAVIPNGAEAGQSVATTAPASTATTLPSPTTVPAPEPRRLTATVSPATGLRDGDVVTIRGEGFPSGSGATVNQCRESIDFGGCNAATERTYPSTGTSFEGTFVVREVIVNRLGFAYDCAVDPCFIEVSVPGGGFVPTKVALSFAADPVAATPASTG